MKLTDLKKLIKESIATQMQLTPANQIQSKPKLERDDVGTFYACIKPIGGEEVNQLIIPTTIMEYGDKCGGKEIHAIVNDENRARRIAERLRKGKISELCQIKNQEIQEVDKQIKKHSALQGALSQYHKLREEEPGEKGKTKQKEYGDKINELNKRKQELLSDMEIIKQGKLPKNSAIQHQTLNEDSALASLANQLEKAADEANTVLQKYYFEQDFTEDIKSLILKKIDEETDPEAKKKKAENEGDIVDIAESKKKVKEGMFGGIKKALSLDKKFHSPQEITNFIADILNKLSKKYTQIKISPSDKGGIKVSNGITSYDYKVENFNKSTQQITLNNLSTTSDDLENSLVKDIKSKFRL